MVLKYTRKILFLLFLACSLIYLTLFNKTNTAFKAFDAASLGIARIDRFLRESSIKVTTKQVTKITTPTNSQTQTNTCRLPKLELIGHTNVEKYVHCKMIHEWGYLKKGHWHLNETVLAMLASTPECEYRNITRPIDDFNLAYSNYSVLNDGQMIESEVIEVKCKTETETFDNIYVQIVNKSKEIENRNRKEGFSDSKESSSSSCKPLNILLLSYDSMSRVSWFKRLPRTTQFLLDKSNEFNLMDGFSILGDGTPACMIPLLTGATEEELPSTLKSNPNAQFVDQAYPFIWNDLHRKDYVSFHMEDWPQVSAFTYRLKGMSNRTAHHYMRAYQFGLWKRVSDAYFSSKDDFCVGNQKRHKRALDLIQEFARMYEGRGRPYIAITHYIENSHDGNARAYQLDGDLRRFLENITTPGNGFDDTVIFLYSDHGARFATERLTPQGALEERMPFFAIRMPTWFKDAHPDEYDNLLKNTKKLITPFDIYATLRDISCLEENNRTKRARAQSLLTLIPAERSCKEIGISMHYCVCELDWQRVDVSLKVSQSVLRFILDYINRMLEPASRFCAKLSLYEMNSIKYATALNTDNGRNESFFKVEFTTNPNRGIYNAVVRMSADSKFSIDSPSSISRTNAYGRQSKCLEMMRSAKAELRVDLRKFCLCKIRAKSPYQNRFNKF